MTISVKTHAHPLRLGGQTFGTGRHLWRIPVTRDLSDAEIALSTHVIVGARPGPTLTLTSTLHGVEWLSIEMIRRAIEAIDPAELSGAVLALPVVNPPALGAFSRCAPDDSDSPDLNRVFPGAHTWINDQIAATVVREILRTPRRSSTSTWVSGAARSGTWRTEAISRTGKWSRTRA